MHKDVLTMINLLSAEDAFAEALQLYNKHDFGTSVPYFLHAMRSIDKGSFHENEYLAAYGLCLIRLGNKDEGFNKCLIAAEAELKNPEVFALLARASILMSRRRIAIKAISQGLVIEPQYAKLRNLRNELGVRREPLFGFLSRDNILNIAFGKLLYMISNT